MRSLFNVMLASCDIAFLKTEQEIEDQTCIQQNTLLANNNNKDNILKPNIAIEYRSNYFLLLIKST